MIFNRVQRRTSQPESPARDGAAARSSTPQLASGPTREIVGSPRADLPQRPPSSLLPLPGRNALRAWAYEAGISVPEHEERRRVAAKLRQASSLFGNPLHVMGRFTVASDSDLSALPPGLRVQGTLCAYRCPGLESLPEGVYVGQDILLGGTSVTSLPPDMYVGGNINLFGGVRIDSISSGLHVGGYFSLADRPLTHWPANVHIGGDLDLEGTSLTRLNSNLYVGGNLDLSNTPLTELPRDLQVGGDLNLSGCTSLTGLPAEMLGWPARSDGAVHHVRLENTGINAETRRRLESWAAEQGDNCGFRFHFSRARATGLSDFASLEEAVAFWQAPAPTDGMPTASVASNVCASLLPLDRETLKLFLGGLRKTAEYKNHATLPHLRERVAGLLRLVQDADDASAIFGLLNDALATCGDRLIRGLDEVEHYMLWTHARGHVDADGRELRRLGEALCRLEIVRQHAAAKVASLVCVDEVEVYLVYETSLAQSLELPFATRSRLFGEAVTDEDLKQAESAARKAMDDTAFVDGWLQAWPPWQKHLRRQQVASLRQAGYGSLQAVSDPAHASAVCPISLLAFAEMEQPVALADVKSPLVVEFESWLSGWVEDNRHPITREPLALEQLRRATLGAP